MRSQYLNQLIKKMHNGRVKIITGIRRCGKSYLLFELFGKYLRENGVQDEQIVELALDEIRNFQYRNPFELDAYIRRQITDKTKQYLIYAVVTASGIVGLLRSTFLPNLA